MAEEKEIARNAVACPSGTAAALSNYTREKRAGVNKQSHQQHEGSKPEVDSRLSKTTKCKCGANFKPWKMYPSGKLNKTAFKECVKCFKRACLKKSEASGIDSDAEEDLPAVVISTQHAEPSKAKRSEEVG